jgi:hypothetical protein
MTNEEQDELVKKLGQWGKELKNGSKEEAALGALMEGLAGQLEIYRKKEGGGVFTAESDIYIPPLNDAVTQRPPFQARPFPTSHPR